MTYSKLRRCVCALFIATVALTATACQHTESKSEATPDHHADSDESPQFVVALDAGHNGGNADHPEIINDKVNVGNGKKPCNTSGTQTRDGYAEHAFNFDVVKRMVALFKNDSVKVVLTRKTDDGVGPCVDRRAEIGNEAHADLALSVHADGGPADGRGFHIMEPKTVKGHNEKIVKPSAAFAKVIAKSVEDGTPMKPSTYIGHDGLNPRDDMGGMNLSKVPTVMVESGNMRNAADAKLLKDKGFRQKLAKSLVDGIMDYLIQNR
ncbi:MAG TPA: N-acetylmuramoyl-L-alanine amidase [Stackebrandtia sp.]|uniref:N-acetylmuramoyl-L-alanine amidase n=1 Tax=Stackebrandtia sp. TaxID=2023065 RepID=UPI002D75E79F|nr:N-acetylmuramoyl-L-alanine amidase [Stackebrandtia sp.]HZE40028.1 N-acetylmuramoyl-L-alanine amidase [Stackebrandtia sp.]